MSTVRRVYIYLVCAISLQVVTWATIALLRNLAVVRPPSPTTIAFEIAVIVIGLPFYLGHWLWSERLARRAEEERGAVLRRVYLYGMMAGFLGAFLGNAFGLVANLFGLLEGGRAFQFIFTPGEGAIFCLLAMVVVAPLWFYHYWVNAQDAKSIPEAGNAALVRRLYVLGFSAVGLTLITSAVVAIIRWISVQVSGGRSGIGGYEVVIWTEVARLIIGLPVWLVFWGWAQRLFSGPSEEERESALRKFYLYCAIFIGILGTVGSATALLAGLFRQAFGLLPMGKAGTSLAVIIGLGVVWAYHAYVLRKDAEIAGIRTAEAGGRQAGVRRLYYYLVAGVGLAAVLVGLGGVLSVIFLALDDGLITFLKSPLSWFLAALIAGLPVWLIPWRKMQNAALASGSVGADERQSLVRKIYLYFYLFVATMAVLSGGIYFISRVIATILGEEAPTIGEVGAAIANIFIAIGVWLYHGAALRSDGRLNRKDEAERLTDLHLVVVDTHERSFGKALLDWMGRNLPSMGVELVALPEQEAEVGEIPAEEASKLTGAGLIVAPANLFLAGETGPGMRQKYSEAIRNSPARKLVVPLRGEGWDWAGVDHWSAEALLQQTTHSIEQIARGQEVKPHRPMSASTIILIVIVVLVIGLPLFANLITLLVGF